MIVSVLILCSFGAVAEQGNGWYIFMAKYADGSIRSCSPQSRYRDGNLYRWEIASDSRSMVYLFYLEDGSEPEVLLKPESRAHPLLVLSEPGVSYPPENEWFYPSGEKKSGRFILIVGPDRQPSLDKAIDSRNPGATERELRRLLIAHGANASSPVPAIAKNGVLRGLFDAITVEAFKTDRTTVALYALE